MTLRKRLRKLLVGSPFRDPTKKRLIVHGGHHRAGSTWFRKILRKVAITYDLVFQFCSQAELENNTDIFVENHTRITPSFLPPHTGSHMIRDPRDIVISGYFYHLWTQESWAHEPNERYYGRSYQEHLGTLSQEDGMLAEIDRFCSFELGCMLSWDYNNSDFVEIRYEDLIYDEASIFRSIFSHYGFSADAIDRSMGVAEQFSFANRSKRKLGEVRSGTHMRSGKPRQWQECFSERHKDHFKQLAGDAVVRLGYEESNEW